MNTRVFDGSIAGLGTSSGLRLVVGRWPTSSFGPFADVMVETAGGHRILLAPTTRLAAFVAGTFEHQPLGDLTPLRPAVPFGFSSAPVTPSLTRVRSFVREPRHGL